jgi:hypothetical protein
LERRKSKPLLCVCVCVCVCVQLCVYTGCVHVWVCAQCLLLFCVGGCYACACVYTSCRDGTWRPSIPVYAFQVCPECVRCCVLCSLYRSLPAALITGCPVFLSLYPFPLCFCYYFSCCSESLCKHMCMRPTCTCDLRVSSEILVPGNMCTVILLPRTKQTN